VSRIRSVCDGDLDRIKSILEEWVVDETGSPLPTEIQSDVDLISESLHGRGDCEFFVAEDDASDVVGVAGLAWFDLAAELSAETERPVEVVTVYVRRDHRGLGLGRALLDEVEARASALGFATLLAVSGSRNRESGYPFWRRRYGEPWRWDEDYFAPGAERVVWRHRLTSERP
jgi:GNAT superfamily N-acetyltransferase